MGLLMAVAVTNARMGDGNVQDAHTFFMPRKTNIGVRDPNNLQDNLDQHPKKRRRTESPKHTLEKKVDNESPSLFEQLSVAANGDSSVTFGTVESDNVGDGRQASGRGARSEDQSSVECATQLRRKNLELRKSSGSSPEISILRSDLSPKDTPSPPWPLPSSSPPKESAPMRDLGLEKYRRPKATDKGDSATPSDSDLPKPGESITPPRKMLKLRSDGKLLSPKSSRSTRETKSKARSRGAGSKTGLNSGMTVIRYGVNPDCRRAIGRKIQDILDGTRRSQQEQNETVRESPKKPKEPSKPLHPFFLGTTARDVEKEPPAPQVIADQQMVSAPRKNNVLSISSPSKAGPLNRNSGAPWAELAKSFRKAPRLPGALEALWPPNGMVHIHPPNTTSGGVRGPCCNSKTDVNQRKLKNTTISISESEDVLRPYRSIALTSRSQKTDDMGTTVLRKPLRKVMTGTELQRCVAKNISCDLSGSLDAADTFQDELSSSQSHTPRTSTSLPSGLQHMYQRIPVSLSAFDKFECDSIDWVHKYAPKQAEEVLQLGPDVSILKEWLRSLTIRAVEGQSGFKRSQDSSMIARSTSMTTKKRRKRRAEALDGFVVSSDEEADKMSEMPRVESLEHASEGQPSPKKSVVRARDLARKQGDVERVTNAVVISGPHGCGKTAAVYAVTQELGFEIFEINAGSRRSGKDLLDKIGDMTSNHLVNRDAEAQSKPAVDDAEDGPGLSSSVTQEIESGRQGTMRSFFHPKAGPMKKSRGRPKRNEDVQKAEPKLKPKKPKSQKQSVILLEEADVLFEEDKQFWATTLEIIVRSKRPLIITCTDEGLLPLEDLQLFAILRFVPAPEPLATDYLLLLAGNEGHLLFRESVSNLYKVKQYDLRASITELNLFCQMAIGDTQGGLGWFLIQPPPNQCLSPKQKGEALRVVSEGSLPEGSGWLNQNLHNQGTLEHDTEFLSELWHGWSLDLADSSDLIGLDAFPVIPDSSKKQVLDSLESIEHALEAVSVADVCSPLGMRQGASTPFDSSLPELLEKSRAQYVEGAILLQADPLVDQTGTSTSLALTLRALARRLLPSPPPLTSSITPKLPLLLQTLRTPRPVTHETFETAFAPLATPLSSTFSAPLSTLATDVAPYIRSITAFDLRLEEQRRQLETTRSDPRDGATSKRSRTTRASRAALEGGAKATTRRERWFPKHLDFGLIRGTGGKGWTEAALSRVDFSTKDGQEDEDVEGRGDMGSTHDGEL